MNTKKLLAPGAAMLAVAAWALLANEEPAPAHLADTVSYERMAGALHAVLRATHKVQAQGGTTEAAAESDGPATKPGPQPGEEPLNHARFLRLAAREIATGGAEFSFALRSPWPINPQGGPQTQVEAAALERVKAGVAEPSFGDELLGGRAYFTAIYPERATASSCVACHNRHPTSPRRDFQRGDLMGAFVIRIPREF